MQHQSSKASHASEESLAMPGVLRAGGGAQSPFTTASMQRAQFSQVSNQQARSGHVLAGVSGCQSMAFIVVYNSHLNSNINGNEE